MRNWITETVTLNLGRARGVGIFEAREMVRAGRTDGKKGLPKIGEDGCWKSALLHREIHACQEYCNKLWVKLQINLEKTYAEIDRIIDGIYLNNAEIRMIEAALLSQEENWDLAERKRGEEKLADSVIYSRRKKELYKATADDRQRLEGLKEDNDKLFEVLRKSRGIVIEATNTTKLMTQKMEEHSRQKIDVYWDAAYENHPEKMMMPPSAEFDLRSEGEMTFMAKHANTDSEMLSILSERYSEKKGEERA